jgi:hypothetical protein
MAIRTNHLRMLVAFFFLLSSCSEEFKMTEHVDPGKPLSLIVQNSSKATTPFGNKVTLSPGDQRFQKLLTWAKENSTGWDAVQGSYVMEDVLIMQGTFRMRYYSSGVVIVGVQEKNGNISQLMKEVKEDELKFLSE